MAGDRGKPGDAARDAVREVGAVVGGAGRRLARGLRDLTRRPEDEAPKDGEAEAEVGEGSGARADDDDLGRKLRELGRDFVDVMGSVSAKTGRGLRQAAFDVADGVRGAIDGARAARNHRDQPPDDRAAGADEPPAGDLEDVD